MANASTVRWSGFAAAAATFGASVSLPQSASTRPPQVPVGYAAPLSADANALERQLRRVFLDLSRAVDGQHSWGDAEALDAEADVDYSGMKAASVAATRAPADLFVGLDRSAFAGLADISYTLDADEG